MTGVGTGQTGISWAFKSVLQSSFIAGETAMQETKPAAQSITIVANLLTVLALLLGLYFKEFGPQQQSAFVEAGSAAAAGILQIVSIWGRMRATRRITGLMTK